MSVIRGIGTLVLVLGAVGVLMRFGGRSMKFYPGTYVGNSFWRWCGRVGVALLGVGVLLVGVSLL